MELVISFKKAEFLNDGTHKSNGKFIMELQGDWEADFHNKFNLYYANIIEAHPIAMNRFNQYYEGGEETNFNFGMEKIDGEIDLDTNLAIDEFTGGQTVFAVGSQLLDNDDNPLFLVKNDNLSPEIILLKYDEEGNDEENLSKEPVAFEILKKI